MAEHESHSCCGGAAHVHHAHGQPVAPIESARDPVCGMTVDRFKAAHRTVAGGRVFLFCGGGCKSRFEADPDAYLHAGGNAASHGHH